MTDTKSKVALIIGAGVSTGSSVARRFAREGFEVCVCRRDRKNELSALTDQIIADGGSARAFSCDARKEDEVIGLVDTIEAEVGPIEVCVHNIGANVKFDIADTTSRIYFKTWEIAAFSAFLVGREAARVMVPRQRGTMIFTGATASTRGAPGFAAFSGAMHAKRSLAQSLARELGPKGIHVAHTIIDGPIDTPWVRENRDDLLGERNWEDNLLEPDAIAEMYWQIHKQPRSAWTWEMDIRPWAEPW